MTDEREKLPPGCRWDCDDSTNELFVMHPCGHDSDTAENAWQTFEVVTGITREKWEAMERAVDFVHLFACDSPVTDFHAEADAILAALGGGDDD